MISKKISGRLGNQMFQYASIRGILSKNNINEIIQLDFSNVYQSGFENDLKNFKIKYSEEVTSVKLNKKQLVVLGLIYIYEKILKLVYKNPSKYEIKKNVFEKKYQKLFVKLGVVKLFDGYMNISLLKNKDYSFFGLFESQKYFDHIRSELVEEFTPKYEPLESNKDLYNKIFSTNSVCISIRRGDFLDKENVERHFVCDEDYYRNAIDIINEKIENATFIIFSDDIEWCKKHFSYLENVEFESGTDPVWEKLRLMYSCKHFIISNSTFSWWAQYLSRNCDKIVIAPSKWKNFGIFEDIYDDSWIKI